jgi:hypothetical protein
MIATGNFQQRVALPRGPDCRRTHRFPRVHGPRQARPGAGSGARAQPEAGGVRSGTAGTTEFQLRGHTKEAVVRP